MVYSCSSTLWRRGRPIGGDAKATGCAARASASSDARTFSCRYFRVGADSAAAFTSTRRMIRSSARATCFRSPPLRLPIIIS